MDCQKLQKKVRSIYGNSIRVTEKDGNIVLSGTLKKWEDIVVPALCAWIKREDIM